jgi:hypothetical protein
MTLWQYLVLGWKRAQAEHMVAFLVVGWVMLGFPMA